MKTLSEFYSKGFLYVNFAWQELANHITYMFEISEAYFEKGIPYMQCKESFFEFRQYLRQKKQ